MRRGNGGFTLFEVLLALALTVLVLQPLLRLSGQALHAAGRAERRAAALQAAEALIAETMLEEPARQATQGQLAGGLLWRRSIERTGPLPTGAGPVRIEVVVSTGDGGEVRLATARLAPAAGEPAR